MQQSFSSLESASKEKLTRRERLLREIDAIVPPPDLSARIEPHYPKGEGCARPPIGLSRMLRMYVVQQCLGLSDKRIEDPDTLSARSVRVVCSQTLKGKRIAFAV